MESEEFALVGNFHQSRETVSEENCGSSRTADAELSTPPQDRNETAVKTYVSDETPSCRYRGCMACLPQDRRLVPTLLTLRESVASL